MKFCVREHQAKSLPYVLALRAAGHVPVPVGEHFDVLLIDLDIPHKDYDSFVERAREIDAAVIVYPHGFTATNQHSLLEEPIEADAVLVPGPGQKRLMELYGYPNPLHVTGWPGPRVEAEPRECKRVLFAPHHPFGSGWLPDPEKQANAEAFELLLGEGYDVEVRHCGELEENGLWHDDRATYHQGSISDGQIQLGDVVVANTTYAAECMIRGVPVVMNRQELWWSMEYEDGREPARPEGWEARRGFTWYPFELGPGVVEQAAAFPNSPAAIAWKERFLGPGFDPEAFVELVEKIAGRVLA